MIIESGVRCARGKTETVETLVEMFLPQLLRASVTRYHTKSFPNHSRIGRSPRVKATETAVRLGHVNEFGSGQQLSVNPPVETMHCDGADGLDDHSLLGTIVATGKSR